MRTAMASRDAEAPLDPSFMGHLSGGDRSAERELVRRFLAFNEHDARMLGHAVGRQDSELAVLVAERMEAAAHAIGALPLAAASARIAKAAREQAWHRVVGAMAELRLEGERLHAFLRAAYPEP